MKFTTTYIPAQLIFILTRLSRNVLIPFFPLYLKYLNLSLIQMGFIRSFQIWTALLFSILWIKTSKGFSNNTLKQITISGVIFTSLTICICMAFIPPYKFINNITHCVNNETSSFQFMFEEHFKKVYGALIQTSYNQSVSTTKFNAISKNNSDFEEGIHTVPELKMKFMKTRNKTNKNLVNDIFKHKSNTNISSEDNVNMNIIHKPFGEFSHKIQPYSKNKKQLTTFITSPANMLYLKKNSKKIYPERRKQLRENKLAVSFKKPESSRSTLNKEVSEGMSFSHSLQNQEKNSDRAINNNFRSSHQVLKENNLGLNVNEKQTNSPSNYQEKQSPSAVSNTMKERNPLFMIDFKNVSVYEHLFPRTKIVYRKPSHDYEMIENDENYKNVEEGNNDLLFDTNIESNSRRERIPEEMESKSVTNEWRKLFRERRSDDQQNVFNRKEGENNREVLKKSSINNYFSNLHKNKVSNSDKYFLLGFVSDTFLFSFILTVLYELFSSQIIPWMETLCCHNTEDSSSNDCLYASLIFIPKSFLYILIYPLLGIVTTVTFCPYQATVHCFASAILFVFTFLASLLILLLNPEIKYFRNRKPSKPPCIENKYEDSHIQRIFTSITCMVVGGCMACYTENILWYAEELPGFFLNYEYLYCGYYFLYIIMLLITSRYLQDQKYSDNSDISDSEDENVHFSFEEVVKHKNIIYIRKQKLNMKLLLGTFLLAVILFVVPFLSRAWTILLLAFLKGVTDSFIGLMVLPGFWFLLVVGYGFGCILGATVATIFGMKVMYFSASAVSFTCCIGWLSYGIFLQYCRRPPTEISLNGHWKNVIMKQSNETDQNDEEEDWLERALLRDQLIETKKPQI